jgi:hypothetical protein
MAEGEQASTSLAAESVSGTSKATEPVTQSQPETQMPEWVSKLEGFDDESKRKLARYKTANDVAKSALEFDKRISQSVPIPGKDANKETWDAFYKRLGRPESKGEYDLDAVFLPDGVTKDDKSDEQFRSIAYDLGLTKEQAKKLHKYAAQQGLDAYGNLKKQMEAQREQSRETLKKEWGSDYDRNVALIGTVLRKFGDDGVIQYLNSGPGNDPAMLKFLTKFGKAISPDTLERGSIPGVSQEDDGSDLFPNSPQMTGVNRERRIR